MYFVKYGFVGLTQEVRNEGMMLSLLLIVFNSIAFMLFHTDNVGKIVPLRRMKQYCCVG
jgi:hypothetical protein